MEVQQESRFQPEERQQIIKEFSEQWERLNNLGSSEDKYLEYLQKATKEMKKISTGSAATNAVINVVQSLKGYSSSSVRQGRIGVQVTSLARRPEGAPKTRNRLPAGRKPNSATDNNTDKLKKTKKPARKRQIAESIRRNIAHVKSH